MRTTLCTLWRFSKKRRAPKLSLILRILIVAGGCSFASSLIAGDKLEPISNLTITAFPGVRVGHYTDEQSLKGCTVVRFGKDGAVVAVDVRGAAPGTRETDLLDPMNLVDRVHALVLSGGSAYGLDASSGVVRCLEAQGIGFPVGEGLVVPIVPSAVLFDLMIGDGHVRPSADWGYQACLSASDEPVASGNVGAGTGATVGKLMGMERAMKSGIGSSLLQLPNQVKVGALVAVNALGDVIDPKTGSIVAGTRGDKKGAFQGAVESLLQLQNKTVFPGTNTTIGIVTLNLPLNKTQAKKVAQMAHDGMARAINPVHTLYDGDTLFVACVPSDQNEAVEVTPDLLNIAGTAAAEAVAAAILDAVDAATSVPGYPAANAWKTE